MTIVFVYGANGNTGKPTIEALATHSGIKGIRIGTRNVDKAKEAFKHIKSPIEYYSDLSDAGLAKGFTGVDVVYLVVPPTEKRAELANQVVKAAQQAKVKYFACVSVLTAADQTGIFGKQFYAVEQAVIGSGIPYGIIRLPMFAENLWALKDSIKSSSVMHGPGVPDAKYCFITAQDIGKFAAQMLAFSSKWPNKIFTLTAPQTHSQQDFANLFSKFIGRPVKYERGPDSATIDTLLKYGVEKWQADGILELWHFINDGKQNFTTTDFHHVTGHQPITGEQFVQQIAPAFK